MRGAPPILWIAVGFAAGAAASTAIGFDRTLLSLLIVSCPIALWRGPKSRAIPLVVAFAAGLGWAVAAERGRQRCAPAATDGAAAALAGYFIQASAEGPSTLVAGTGPGGCRAQMRVYVRDEAPPEARPVVVRGRWFRSVRPDGSEAVSLVASGVEEAEGEVPWTVRIRAAIRRRAAAALELRVGSQAAVASALVLAERHGVSRELWDAFARSGTAHLLSISGFHVGVVAALLGGLLSTAALPPRRRALGIAIGVWAYVLVIGAPTSATRAAWMTTAFVLGRLRQTPARALGALGLSMLMIALLRPETVAGAGFQLTVTGTAGILVMTRWIMKHWPDHPFRDWIASPVAAGIGASVFTAPVLAYHFGQIPLLSLPASIALTPLVAAAVPGVIVTIVLDMLHLPGASMAGMGAEGLLFAVTRAAAWMGALSRYGRVADAPRGSPPHCGGPRADGADPGSRGGPVPWSGPRSRASRRWRCSGRDRPRSWSRGVEPSGSSPLTWGQGDAIAIRTPGGRWLLVDAGPRTLGGYDAGLARVVPYLQSQGARRLEAIVLSHPDEDHAGGLASVLRHIRTESVLGPGLGSGQAGHMDGLAEAREAGVPWRRAVRGDAWQIDGVRFEVLHPPREGMDPRRAERMVGRLPAGVRGLRGGLHRRRRRRGGGADHGGGRGRARRPAPSARRRRAAACAAPGRSHPPEGGASREHHLDLGGVPGTHLARGGDHSGGGPQPLRPPGPGRDLAAAAGGGARLQDRPARHRHRHRAQRRQHRGQDQPGLTPPTPLPLAAGDPGGASGNAPLHADAHPDAARTTRSPERRQPPSLRAAPPRPIILRVPEGFVY